MTNLNIKRELDLIHQGLIDLRDICKNGGHQVVTLETFVRLLGDRFENVQPEIESILSVMDLHEVYKAQGNEAAMKLLDTWGKATGTDSRSLP